MHEDGGAAAVELLEEGHELRREQVAAAGVGQHADAVGAELVQRAGRLGDGGVNVRERKGGEEAEAIRPVLDHLRERVVDLGGRGAGRAFDALTTALRQGRERSAHEAGRGLTAAQVDLLAGLLDAPTGLSVSRIAAAAGVAGPTATRMLNGLAHRGVVEHRRDAQDGRLRIVQLTPSGRSDLAAHLAVLRRRQRAAYHALDADAREQLVLTVHRMTEVMREL